MSEQERAARRQRLEALREAGCEPFPARSPNAARLYSIGPPVELKRLPTCPLSYTPAVLR